MNERNVVNVARCTSKPWIVLESIDRFSDSQLSTDLSSANRLSSSSIFNMGDIGNDCANPLAPAKLVHARRIISRPANNGFHARSLPACPKPGSTKGLLSADWDIVGSCICGGQRRFAQTCYRFSGN